MWKISLQIEFFEVDTPHQCLLNGWQMYFHGSGNRQSEQDGHHWLILAKFSLERQVIFYFRFLFAFWESSCSQVLVPSWSVKQYLGCISWVCKYPIYPICSIVPKWDLELISSYIYTTFIGFPVACWAETCVNQQDQASFSILGIRPCF